MLEKAEKIFNDLKDIEYGWIDSNGRKHRHITEGYFAKYRFQLPEELLKTRFGCCWETSALSKELLIKEGVPAKNYFFVIQYKNFFCHSITVFKENNKIYWIELSQKDYIGIHEYNSMEELMNFIVDNFDKIMHREEKINLSDIKIFEYETPKRKLNCVAFYFHCFAGKNLTKKYNHKIKK